MTIRVIWLWLALCVAVLPVLGNAPAQAAAPALNNIQIVLDPGHGGLDFGIDPAGSGLQEKAVALDLAQRLQQQLAAEGAVVAVTRASDQFIALNARVRYSNAVLFRPDNAATIGRLVSLHINSNPRQPDLRRVEVLVDPQAPGPFTFAADLAAKLRTATGGSVGYRDADYPDGVHPADVAPVRWTFPRGLNVLSESAFLSNQVQAAQLRDPAFLDAIARAHLAALRTEFSR